MANNFLKYSNLTYDEIVQQIRDKLNSDPRFQNFRESAIAQLMVEIFAGTVDLVNFNIERSAEEGFMDTAKRKSSVILLARSLGYVVTRPIPANTSIKIKLKGDFRDLISSSDKLQIPAQSIFTYNGLKYLLKKTLEINLAPYIGQMNLDGSSFESDYISVDVSNKTFDLVQGEIKEKVIEGSTNPQVGSTFQIYRIEDTEFSNIYGSEEYDIPVTKVWVGNNKSDDEEYTIDRRSLINWEVIDAFQDEQTVKVCVVRTAIGEGVEILFGDGRYAELGASTSGSGALTTFDNVYIQYLATKGSKANQTGVKDKKIIFSGKAFTNKGVDITTKVEFYFDSNITGGADLEDIESIRINSPNIYYSLDRLTSKTDYINYLKSLTSPISIKNAIAYGEQERINEEGVDAISKLFNCVLFSCLGSLYSLDGTTYYPYDDRELSNKLLDYTFNVDSIADHNSYFNLYVKQDVVRQLREYESTSFVWANYGETLPSSAVGTYFAQAYGQNMKFEFQYTSDVAANNINLSVWSNFTIDVRTLSAMTRTDALNAMASKIQTELLAFTDTRGTSLTDNANYNQTAFNNISVVYDSTADRFEIVHSPTSPCYIIQLSGAAANDSGWTSATYLQSELVLTDNSLSKNIINVLDNVDKRAQATVRNIYMQPVIHKMKLNGVVKIKSLYDIDEEKRNTENDIFTFMNNQADFNEDVYLSNLIEVIENRTGVVYANVSFSGTEPVNPTGTKFYVTGNNANVDRAFSNTTERAMAYIGIDTIINNDWAFKTHDIRTFFDTFCYALYNKFDGLGGNYTSFANSDDFLKLCDDIYKDYVGEIRNNLIDADGNITQYSMNHEIVQLHLDLDYSYNT